MKTNIFFFIFFFTVIQLFANNDSLQPEKVKRVYVFDIKEEIAAQVWRKTDKAFHEAEEMKADIVLIQMNTFGGALDAADKIRTRILQSKIPVYVFIDHNAASAGALISIACDSIYMRSGSSIGAATVVNQSGEVLPDKYQSYMRAMMRATAQAKGRNSQIAEAMVDPSVYIPGIIDSGKVLTFTTEEAIKNGYCQSKAETRDDVFANAGIKEYEITEQKLSVLDEFIGFLVNPVVSGILIMIIIAGLYFEFQSPGIGFPLFAAITAALLYFAPLYLDGLANHWEILIFIIGLVLLALEIFVIPGFGVAGIAGITLSVFGLALAMIGNDGFNFKYVETDTIFKSFLTVIIASFGSLVLSIWLGKKMLTTTRFGELSLQTVQDKNKGYTSADLSMNQLIGKEGEAYSILRPGGKVKVEDSIYDAIAQTSYIERHEKIIVVGFQNTQLIVRKK